MPLQRHDPSQAYLIIALAVENAPADVVAADVGIDPAQLVAALGKAVRALARAYESLTCARAVDEPTLGLALRNARPRHR